MTLKLGTLLQTQKYGVCTVLSSNKTGHQYERYYEYEILTPVGSIITVDEYQFRGDKIKIIKEIEND